MMWEAAYEEQLAIWQWWASPMGRAFARGFGRSLRDRSGERVEELGPQYAQPGIEREAAWVAEHLPEQQRGVLLDADPIAVDPDMMTMWEAASATFAPEPLAMTDLLAPVGFVYLPRPAYILDIHGKRIGYRAITWGRMRYTTPDAAEPDPNFGNGIFIALYSRRGDPDDYTDGITSADWTWSVAHSSNWGYGQAYDDLPVGGMRSVAQQLQSLFRLMQQTIVIHDREMPTRPTRRRAAKADFPGKKVVVVRLRRPNAAPRGEEVGKPQWSHRWLVSGHWRNQWYPSLGMHRQIWISPFVKGPEDKPLQLRTVHAYELVR
jgi:hypothetical protein